MSTPIRAILVILSLLVVAPLVSAATAPTPLAVPPCENYVSCP